MEQVFFNVPLNKLEPIAKKWLKDVLADFQTQPSQQHTEPEERLTRKQLAKYLGRTLPTIDRYKDSGVIPYYQTGRTIYFKRSEVDAALAVRKKKGAFK